MSRASLNISFSETLRRAQIRPRLDTLAEHTGLAATQIAGRALTLGLALIESDLRRLFPGQAMEGNVAPLVALPSTAADDTQSQPAASPYAAPPHAEQPSAVIECDAQPCDAAHRTDTERAATTSPAPPDTVEPTEPLPRFVSTADAARALGYREESAFLQHTQRHIEVKKLSKKQGRSRLWDLPKLRAEYARRQWQPR